MSGEQLLKVKTRTELDELLAEGTDINARTDWWAGGFGLLDMAPPEVAQYALERGAKLTAHAAARLGLIGELKKLLEDNPACVHERGGDGQMPLHFASTVEIAALLLDHGAEIDARDIDHESTAAQYMLSARSEVARYLVERGCQTDLLMAAALGDLGLAERHLDSIRMRVSDEYFPMVGGGRAGGTIYQWQLGWYVGAAQTAKKFGHAELLEWIMERSPADEKLLNACWLGNRNLAHALRETVLPAPALRHVAHAARNNDLPAVELMLLSGLPAQAYSQHHGSSLHWAAWHGNVAMIRLLLANQAELQNNDNDYKGTPLNWAKHARENGGWYDTGDYAAAEALLQGGVMD